MLAQIFGSNARVKILKTFLSKPEQKYYTRQLARDLALQVNSVRREPGNRTKCYKPNDRETIFRS